MDYEAVEPQQHNTYGVLRALFGIFIEVVFFWQLRLYGWWTQKSPKATLIDALQNASSYEEWETAAYQLDELMGNDLWRQNATSKYYDYRLIYTRLQSIIAAQEEADILSLVNLLRSGLVRNLGNITAPRLFNRAYAGTKLLIEEYITQVALAIKHVASFPTSRSSEHGLTSQAKLDLLHDTRQAFGRTALVLQGGAIFGLCHLGVVKALHLRGLLPRIIAGTATGALIAALVGVHTEDELLDVLTGDRIDLSAFARRTKRSESVQLSETRDTFAWLMTLLRRIKRFIREGYFLDVRVLEECVRANVGDLTFDEAYAKTKRVLNITLVTPDAGDVPALLNYITAPNVLVWSAAIASNASSAPLFSSVPLLCKSSTSQIVPWASTPTNSTATSPNSSTPRSHAPPTPYYSMGYSTPSNADSRDSPLSRIAELFNVNHFLVSQARPSIAPFLQSGDILSHALPRHSSTRRRGFIIRPLLRILVLEIQHRLRQLDMLGLLHGGIRRFLLDEPVPGTSLTIVPKLTMGDFVGLLERPTKQGVEEWIRRGETSVWPAVGALKIRCAVEVELDRQYQIVRRRKPMDVVETGVGDGEAPADKAQQDGRKGSSGEKRTRARSNSLAVAAAADKHSRGGVKSMAAERVVV